MERIDRFGLQMEKNSKGYHVRAIERAMQILSSFDGQHAKQGVSEIAQATGLHKATTHRILMTLLSGGFLDRTADGERFRLGLRLVELGLGAMRGLDFRRTAFPYMQQLVERFQEICTLAIFDRGQMLYVEVVHSERSLTVAARVGRRLPVHCTASGKVLLAFLPPEVVEPILNAPLVAYTEKTLTSPEQLRAAGATVGPFMVVIAFFVAPFFGLLWAAYQMLSRKTRQIPYGPFLSMGIFTVMMLHDRLWDFFSSLYIS